MHDLFYTMQNFFNCSPCSLVRQTDSLGRVDSHTDRQSVSEEFTVIQSLGRVHGHTDSLGRVHGHTDIHSLGRVCGYTDIQRD